jgi:tripartite ATP-independent transporter DctP family solute receptor
MKNNTKKAIIGLGVVLVLLLGLWFVIGRQPAEEPVAEKPAAVTPQPVTPQPQPQPVAEKPEPQELVFATTDSPEGAESRLQKMVAELIEERTEGAITFEHVFGGAIGGDKLVTEMLGQGLLQLSRTGGFPSANYLKDVMAINIPFLFKEWEQVERFRDEFRDEMNKEAAKYNLYILAWTMRNPRLLTSNVAVRSPEDIKGLKLRLPEFPTWVHVWGKLGAIATPMPFVEVYGALERGIVDAQENPIETIYAQKFYEVQDYLIMTEHMRWISEWSVNLEWFMGLPEETRNIIKEAFLEMEQYALEVKPEFEGRLLTSIADKIEIIEVDKDALWKAAAPIVREAVEQFMRPDVKEWLLKEGLIQ